MWYVYRIQRTVQKEDAVRVVARDVDEALECLRATEGDVVKPIEVDREHMMAANTGLDGYQVRYVAGLSDAIGYARKACDVVEPEPAADDPGEIDTMAGARKGGRLAGLGEHCMAVAEAREAGRPLPAVPGSPGETDARKATDEAQPDLL